MWKTLTTNWTTSVPGLLIALCGTAEVLGLIPPDYGKYAVALCAFLTAAGFLAAKSANVSNAPHPVSAHAVSAEAGELVNPSAPVTVVPPVVKP